MLAAFTLVERWRIGSGQFSNLECSPATYPDRSVTMSQRGPVPTFWMVLCHSHTPGPRLTSPSARWESPLMCEQSWLPAWACQIQMPHRSEGAFYSLFNSNFKNPPVLFFFHKEISQTSGPGYWLPLNSVLIKKSALFRLSCFLFLVDPGSTNSSIGCVWKSSGLVSDEGPAVREKEACLPSFWNPIKCFILGLGPTWG